MLYNIALGYHDNIFKISLWTRRFSKTRPTQLGRFFGSFKKLIGFQNEVVQMHLAQVPAFAIEQVITCYFKGQSSSG